MGKPFNRRSPFLIGMAAAAGVAVTYGLVLVLAGVKDVLILIGLAFFLAIGLEPIVSWLVARRWPRWFAVFLAALGAVGGFLAFQEAIDNAFGGGSGLSGGCWAPGRWCSTR